MREVIGRRELEPIITTDRQRSSKRCSQLMQQVLNDYRAGVRIMQVQLRTLTAAAPQVYRSLQRRRQRQPGRRNRRQQRQPRQRPPRQRRASAIEGQVVRASHRRRGSASTAVYAEYRLAPQVTRDRHLSRNHGARVPARQSGDPGSAAAATCTYLPLDGMIRRNATTPQPQVEDALMPRSLLLIGVVVFAVLVVALNTMFIVRQDRQAIVLRFGAVRARHQRSRTTTSPASTSSGPSSRRVVIYDKRNLGLTLAGQQTRRVRSGALDRRRRRALAHHRSAPLLPQRVQLKRAARSASPSSRKPLCGAPSAAPPRTTSSPAAAPRSMQQIEDDLNAAAAGESRRARRSTCASAKSTSRNETQSRIYARMSSERQQVAAASRAEGERNATLIRATAQQESAASPR